jgi:hypothetical protein
MNDFNLIATSIREAEAVELERPEDLIRHYRYRSFPNPYPELPNFGILYLSVPRAATLIVEALHEQDRYPFSSLRAVNLTPTLLEERTVKLKTELLAKIQAYLVQAISKGRLQSVTKTGSLKEFIEYGDEAPIISHTYIFYGELLNWLRNCGYEDGLFKGDFLEFEDYEDSELALAKEVEHLVRRRRELQGFDSSELESTNEWVMPESEPNFEGPLSRALDEIRNLKHQLYRASVSPRRRRLHGKEENSILIVLAALLKLKDATDDEDLVRNIKRTAHVMGLRISRNNIKTKLKEAFALMPLK